MARELTKEQLKAKAAKTARKKAKKNPLLAIIFCAALAVGAVAGFFTTQAIAGQDKFEIVGQQTINLAVGEDYVEEGATAICFGADISDKVKIEVDPKLDTSKEGVYYVKYTIDNIRFKEIVRYRYIVVSKPSEEVGQ